ncbi:hypothetical protein GCM10027612_51020 [Microbispora bryophytorum subsp. camponoti]
MRTDEPLIVLLSTSDTDLLSARASGAAFRLGNPARLAVDDLPALVEGPASWSSGCSAGGAPGRTGWTPCSRGRARWSSSAVSRPRTPS